MNEVCGTLFEDIDGELKICVLPRHSSNGHAADDGEGFVNNLNEFDDYSFTLEENRYDDEDWFEL